MEINVIEIKTSEIRKKFGLKKEQWFKLVNDV